MGNRIILIAFALALGLQASATQKQNGNNTVANLPEKEIRDLSYAIKAAQTYRQDKRDQIDSLKNRLQAAPTDHQKFHLAIELSNMFRPMNTDSALHYAHEARSLAENLQEDDIQLGRIAIINALSTAGLFTDATERFNHISGQRMTKEVKIAYWTAGRRLYGYMRGYAQGNKECYAKYDKKYQAYDDSLIMVLPEGSDFRQFIICERLVTDGKYHEAFDKLRHLLERVPQETNLYGMAAYQMAEVWRNLGEEEKYAAMLALSALSDVKGCVTEGLALPTLAYWLYQQGELQEAFSFINFALEEASAGNARMRAVSIAYLVPLIDEAYQERINSSRDELMVYFLLVTILFIVTVVLIVFLTRQIKKSKANAEKLEQTAHRQESYIGNFIGLYSTYADRLNHLTRLVSTKLAAGQGAELKRLIDSGKFEDQDNDDIHKIFDAAFLDIYPDFIQQVNNLLRPEEQITIKTPATLTPELRIYAFVRLGVEESTRIAQILHYSTNTVYAYRNKMRNKAVRRDTFDHDITTIS